MLRRPTADDAMSSALLLRWRSRPRWLNDARPRLGFLARRLRLRVTMEPGREAVVVVALHALDAVLVVDDVLVAVRQEPALAEAAAVERDGVPTVLPHLRRVHRVVALATHVLHPPGSAK